MTRRQVCRTVFRGIAHAESVCVRAREERPVCHGRSGHSSCLGSGPLRSAASRGCVDVRPVMPLPVSRICDALRQGARDMNRGADPRRFICHKRVRAVKACQRCHRDRESLSRSTERLGCLITGATSTRSAWHSESEHNVRRYVDCARSSIQIRIILPCTALLASHRDSDDRSDKLSRYWRHAR